MAKHSIVQSALTRLSAVVSIGLFGALINCSEQPEAKSRKRDVRPAAASNTAAEKPEPPPDPPTGPTVAKSFAFSGELTANSMDPEESGYNALGDCVWAAYYGTDDDTFKRTTVLLFKGGTHLTAERTEQLEDHIQSFQKEMAKLETESDPDVVSSSMDDAFRIFDLSPNRKGYGFVNGFGPGGVGYAVVWTSPEGEYDVRVEISLSSNELFVETKKTEKYYAAVSRPLALLEHVAKTLDGELFGDRGGYSIEEAEAAALLKPVTASQQD